MDIIERLKFDAARCEATFSKGVASNIEEAAAEIERLRAALKTIAEWKDNSYWPAEETRDAIRYFADSALYEQTVADEKK